MKLSDFTCPSCGAAYEVAESISAKGKPGRADCIVCGGLLDSWQAPKMIAYRLVSPAQHQYSLVAPPPPMVSTSG